MSRVCLLLLVLVKFLSIYGYPGETLMIMPPLEVRTVDKYPFLDQFPTSRRPQRQQQQILHTKSDPAVTTSLTNNRSRESSLSNFIEGLNALQFRQKEKESLQFHSANKEREGNDSVYRLNSGPYPLPSSSKYGSAPVYQSYQKPVSILPEAVLSKDASLKPELSTLFKPVTTKVTNKASGLLSLILALFSGSSSDGLQLNGLSELVINGIVKPLLIAKGGIKSLISKITIPLIALLLINLEVLITVWWLWEDCETPKRLTPTYSYQKPAYNYNTYTSYR